MTIKRSMPADGEAHVWYGDTEMLVDPVLARAYREVLSAEERHREKRFQFDADRRQFLFAHGMLRVVLSQYLQCAPATIMFSRNFYGKPTLAYPEVPEFEFNISPHVGTGCVRRWKKLPCGGRCRTIGPKRGRIGPCTPLFLAIRIRAARIGAGLEPTAALLSTVDTQGSLHQGTGDRPLHPACRLLIRAPGRPVADHFVRSSHRGLAEQLAFLKCRNYRSPSRGSRPPCATGHLARMPVA